MKAKRAREAEMAKLLENTFRHVNIALVNEMVRFCDELDIDLWDAIDCAETKPFGYMAFRPGPGVGGHCIPVDPSYLSHRVKAKLGYAFRLVELAEEINTAAPLYVAERDPGPAQRRGLSVRGAGAAPRRDVQAEHVRPPREPGRPVGPAAPDVGRDLGYHDPHVPTWDVRAPEGRLSIDCVPDLEEAVAAADVVVLLQRHREYDVDALGAWPAACSTPGELRRRAVLWFVSETGLQG